MLDRKVEREFLDGELKEVEISDNLFKEAPLETLCKYVEVDYYEWL